MRSPPTGARRFALTAAKMVAHFCAAVLFEEATGRVKRMREVLEQVRAWLAAGRRVAAGTVVATERSAPREPGAVMAVSDRGDVAGSVSGGCVEGALYEEANAVLREGRPRLVTYGIADDEAFAVGLSCGGTIRVFVETLRADVCSELAEALRAERPVAVATAIAGPLAGGKLLVYAEGTSGSLGGVALDAAVAGDARDMLRWGRTGTRRYGAGGQPAGGSAPGPDDVEVFIESFAPPPRLFVFGAVAFGAALARAGKLLGFSVTVSDARSLFATRERFPDADEVLQRWPHELIAERRPGPRDAVCVLTHDPKFDVPALVAALGTEAGYIGALGSRRTNERRVAELRAHGVTDEQLRRVAAPIGLDIGARTPEETAVAILAEIVAVRNGRGGGRLVEAAGRIHAG